MHLVEQETSITYSAADEHVHIWTCIAADVRTLRKDERFTEVTSGTYNDGVQWAEFTIPRKRWSTPRGARTTRVLSDEQKVASAERLASWRQKTKSA